MGKNHKKLFMRSAAALCAAAMFIGLAKPAAAAANETEYVGFAFGASIFDNVSLLSFSMMGIGDQTLLSPTGLSSGDVCNGNCLGNLHIKAFANSDKLSKKSFSDAENDAFLDNVGMTVSYSSDRKYNNFDARYAVFGGYMMSRTKLPSYMPASDHYENQTPFLGVSAEMYKGGFFSGLVLDAAYMQGKMMFENDRDVDSDSWAGGAGLKLGYNMNLGKIGFQPFGTASYSYFKADRYSTEKYHADNGVSLNPGLKAALDLGKCWTLTAMGDYNWLYIKNNAIRVDNTAEMMINYVEYGLGLQKKWSNVALSANGAHRDGKRNGWYADLNLEMRF